MKGRKKEIEINASIESVYRIMEKYPQLNPHECDEIRFKKNNMWMEINGGEVERYCEIRCEEDKYMVVIQIYNTNNWKDFDEEIIIKAKRNEGRTLVIMECTPGDKLACQIGFYARRYSIDLWMEKVLAKMKDSL